jgi:hypothetical protein
MPPGTPLHDGRPKIGGFSGRHDELQSDGVHQISDPLAQIRRQLVRDRFVTLGYIRISGGQQAELGMQKPPLRIAGFGQGITVGGGAQRVGMICNTDPQTRQTAG